MRTLSNLARFALDRQAIISAVRLQLLGPPRAWRDEQPLAFKTRKTLALLAYLAAERGLHSRDQLTALLWPDRGEAEARNSLRSALVYLRQALGDADAALAVTRETVGLSLSPSCILDIQVLAQAQRLARRPEVVPGLQAALERAVAAYGGPFLEGLSVQDAPEFEDWVAGQRAHWLGVVGELLDRLATLHVDEGDLGAAAGTLERWVALDPGEEGAWQRLIAAHLERGDGAAARRAWAACRAALADLGVAPSAATETVAARIATFAPARRGSPIGSGRNDPVGLDVSVVPLVGRGRELARLRQAYARAQTAGAQVVVLEGETGSGKTRLATEFLDWARGQDAEVLVGRTFEAEGGLPYAPLVAALRPRLERENAPDDLLGDLWLAELRERYPDLPPVSEDETVGRGRLFEAVARLAQALVERAPLVLFLDDVQWAVGLMRQWGCSVRYSATRPARCSL